MYKIEMARKGVVALSCWRLLLLVVVVLVVLPNCVSLAINVGDTLGSGASLSGNQSIISNNGYFALGFFSPDGSTNWYVGIWYAQIPEKTVVWVANRETPMKNMDGVFILATDGRLKLFDSEEHSIWSTNNVAKASRALLEDSGNFVMLGGNNSKSVWESFGCPGDTWLPGMKLWKGQKLTSWKSPTNPASGPFSLSMDPSPGKTQLFLLYEKNVSYWSSGEWTGDSFTNMPEVSPSKVDVVFVKLSPSKMYLTYKLPQNLKTMARFVLHNAGEARVYVLLDNQRWLLGWSQPRDPCGVYDFCGAFGACRNDNSQFCSCLQGFNFTPNSKRPSSWGSEEWRSSGCVRRSPLQCSPIHGTTDGFLELSGKSLSDGRPVSYDREQTLQGCRILCLKNCSCTAFAMTASNTPICQLWFGDLLNVRASPVGQSLYIRLAASELQPPSSKDGRAVTALSILLPTVAALIALLALLFALFIRRRRQRFLTKRKEDISSMSLKTFTYKELRIATKKFSHKLGSGAFGSVFKGTLPDSTLVAVKNLESSAHREKQFRAEISTIGNIQHVNLVRLCGFCIDRSRRLLVYEYMSNGSLNTFLFAKLQQAPIVLDWNTRFKIVVGIARGLVYLHEECRDRIIHCDIKPENILLDQDFRPKLADFGLAKLVGRDFSRVLTTTRGTRGYLAPEWISGLPITSKADVYSFGMTVLEIISGRRNLDLTMEDTSRLYFPTWAASQLGKGDVTSVVDAKIADNVDVEEVRRAAVVGILCIEEDENVRPNMSHVMQILEGLHLTT